MDPFHLFEKRSFRFKNDDEKAKNEKIVLKKDRLIKTVVFDKVRLVKLTNVDVITKNYDYWK